MPYSSVARCGFPFPYLQTSPYTYSDFVRFLPSIPASQTPFFLHRFFLFSALLLPLSTHVPPSSPPWVTVLTPFFLKITENNSCFWPAGVQVTNCCEEKKKKKKKIEMRRRKTDRKPVHSRVLTGNEKIIVKNRNVLLTVDQ